MTARIGQPLSKKKKQTKKSAKTNAEHRCSGNKNASKICRRSENLGKLRKHSEIQIVLLEKYKGHLPLDPMQWNREDVTVWLRIMSKRYQLDIDYNMFMMNGKGLCLMSLNGFKYRSPVGGALLHFDLRQKLLTKLLLQSQRSAAA
uniref:Transforming protein p54/c-ets-1 n=1 Tax=Phallusia mammillata TaxID=59560 RepID=A0A6F9DCS7_9ASCI|nr:transforming protein p54/c-ets-1 [Phallusia mammillata]